MVAFELNDKVPGVAVVLNMLIGEERKEIPILPVVLTALVSPSGCPEVLLPIGATIGPAPNSFKVQEGLVLVPLTYVALMKLFLFVSLIPAEPLTRRGTSIGSVFAFSTILILVGRAGESLIAVYPPGQYPLGLDPG
jgi:hypothetical protein